MQEDELLKNEKTYDAVFWTALNTLERYIVPLINEVFGKNYPSDAQVRLVPLKHEIEGTDGSFTEKEMDALAEIREGSLCHLYHIELQTWPDDTFAVRLAEYGLASAYENVEYFPGGARIKVPESAVIFLRNGEKTPDEFTIVIEYPGGKISYKTPVKYMRDYPVDRIFDKKLILLLPFFIFNLISNHKEMMTDKELFSKLLYDDLYEIDEKLRTLVDSHELREDEKSHLIDWIKRILLKFTVEKKALREEVYDIMGGKLLYTRTDELLDQGRAEGRAEGRMEGRAEGRTEGREENILDSIKKLMKNLKYTADQAMDTLEIPSSERNKYMSLL